MTVADLDGLGLPRIFSPADAAGVLRGLGLGDITECALRTRAYRKQVPFHLNGRRIVFTVDDLREIAEGEACRPVTRAEAARHRSEPRPAPRRHLPGHGSQPGDGAWRARTRSPSVPESRVHGR